MRAELEAESRWVSFNDLDWLGPIPTLPGVDARLVVNCRASVA